VTFKEFRKLLEQRQQHIGSLVEQSKLLEELFKGKPFWIWNVDEHKQEDIRTKGLCCVTHLLGPPKLNGIDKPMFPYEQELYDALQNYRDICIKKSRGIGGSEFILRYLIWLALSQNSEYRDKRFHIVTGPRIDIASDLIKRTRDIVSLNYPQLVGDTKEVIADIAGVIFQAFPSHTVNTMRGYTDVKAIIIDEASYFPRSQQIDARLVAEGYRNKTNPIIVIMSTPQAPGDLLHEIEFEEPSAYHKINLLYEKGLGYIYSKEQIEREKKEAYFPREYEGKYIGVIGNVFSQLSIDRALEQKYDPDKVVLNAAKSVGIDAAWGSSEFAITVAQYVNGQIQIIYCQQFHRPNFNEIIDKILGLKEQFGHISNTYVDASTPELIEALKRGIGERYDEQYIHDTISYCKKNNLDVELRMKIIPVPFSIEGSYMLEHAKALLDTDGLVAIDNNRFPDLVISLRSAITNDMFKLDKEKTTYPDLLDSFRLCMLFFKTDAQEKDVLIAKTA
jgi:hypothetical protein